MYFIYSFLLATWIIVMLPYFAYRAIVSQKYLPKLRERTGKLPESLKADGRPTIWFHSCSVGETLSVQPLAHALHIRFPHARFVFSVITGPGRKIAEERFAAYGDGCVFYLPIDLPSFVNKVLNHIKPQMLICIDTEIWPNVIHECKKRDIPVFLANGRISAKSFKSYRWLQPVLASVLSNYTLLMMKSEEDAERIRRMGALPSRVRISGNIKFDRDIVEQAVVDALRDAIDRSFGLSTQDSPLIVVGSTHEREEEVVFDVLAAVRKHPDLEGTRLLIAPRHPERFESVAGLAQRMGHTIVKRTDNAPNPNASVLLLNSIGELATAYSFATVAMVGGTLIPFGGQSIMEPALYGKAIVIGPSMENFPKIIDEFRERQAIWQISAGIDQPELQRTQLTEALTDLLTDSARRAQLGERAESIFEESKGATAFTVDHISEVFATMVR